LPLYLDFNKRFYSGPPYLQRHPYTNNSVGSPSSRYPLYDFFPYLYHNLRHFVKRFYSGTPYLQRHHYANTIFGFPSTRYLPRDFLPPIYLHFNKFN